MFKYEFVKLTDMINIYMLYIAPKNNKNIEIYINEINIEIGLINESNKTEMKYDVNIKLKDNKIWNKFWIENSKEDFDCTIEYSRDIIRFESICSAYWFYDFYCYKK